MPNRPTSKLHAACQSWTLDEFEFWESHNNIADLLAFLDDRGELLTVDAAIEVVREPWKWLPEFRELIHEERAS